jgi:hypothetical protein
MTVPFLTVGGKAIGVLAAFLGVGLFAMPAGMLSQMTEAGMGL